MPAAGEAPAGVEQALWDEVGWLPGPVETLSEFTRPESAAVVQWLAGVVADAAPCHRALTGVDHYFLVAAPGAEPTHVLWGDAKRDDVEQCATTLRLGGEPRVTRDGARTRVATANGEMWLLWMAVGDRTVVVADRTPARLDAFAAAESRIGGDDAIAEALAHVDRDADTWSVSRVDVTSAHLGAPSRAHAFSITGLADGRPDLHLRAWARFDDPAGAQRAKATLDARVGALQERRDEPLGYTANLDGATVSATLRLRSMAELAELRGPG